MYLLPENDMVDEPVAPTEIVIHDHASPFDPNGYYVVVGEEMTETLYCVDCAENGDRAGAALEGDEWEPVTSDDASDYPMHCSSCEALILTSLTQYGKNYVAERIAAADGAPEILLAWKTAWPSLVEQQ